jgi:uridine kinase
LLAGPSSSGKTTTAKKLALYLENKGFNTITISTDDYFLDRDETPKNANGEYDFESINAIDLKLFNSHLTKLLKGEKVLIPEFDFVNGVKEFKKNYVKMDSNDVLVIEGLHCLNEKLTSAIPRKNKYKIFIAPFAQLNIDNHNRIHTSDTRRLRRIIRDNRTRGRSAAETLRMWSNIRNGEFKWIYPYQNDADTVINSALPYELGVLKTYVEPLLYSVDEEDEMYPEALRLINVLRNVLPITSDYIPSDSVIREFIGGSGFYDI